MDGWFGLFVSEKSTLHARVSQPQVWTWFAVSVVMLASGCVRRRLMVRTQPPGATVSIDNQVIGTSPAASPFVYYGTREFRIEKEGFRTETIRRNIRPPWYQFPGIDFVAETLWPGEIRDERVIDVQLVPQTLEPSENLLQRAQSLRSQSRFGVVSGPVQPTPAQPTPIQPTSVPPGT